MDNGFLSCSHPQLLQRICDGLSAARIDRFVRKWLARLPHPFTAADRRAGYRYDISILQAEFSLTQSLDRPLSGRVFFDQVIRENLDIGRPDHVGLVFDRRIVRRGPSATPGQFRTRVITEGVTPSLHIYYKRSKVKQYHKEERALRTETTINDTRDFAIGKRLHNLPALREVGFSANRRLLRVQRISHEPWAGDAAFTQVAAPVVVDGQRAAALRFGHPRVHALFAVNRPGFDGGSVLWFLGDPGMRLRESIEEVVDLLGEAVCGVSAQADSDDDAAVASPEMHGPCPLGVASAGAG